MKPAVIFSILIPCIGLLSFAQSHSIEKRSLKLLLGAKALLLKKKLALLGLGELAGHSGGGFGYAGGYDHPVYGGNGGGVQLGGLLEKKLSLFGLKGSAPQGGAPQGGVYVDGGYGNGGYVNVVHGNGGYVNGGYADGHPHIHHNHDYSSQVPERVVIVKVVSDGSSSAGSSAGSSGGSYDSGYNGVYGSGGYNGVYNIYPNSGVYGISGHKVVSGHVGYDYNHGHYPGC